MTIDRYTVKAAYVKFWQLNDKHYNVVLHSDHEQAIHKLQAKIDSLMLEYCSNDMTEEQLDNWAKCQTSKPLCLCSSERECKEMGCCFTDCIN